MNHTVCHARYFAHEVTERSMVSICGLASAVGYAQVDFGSQRFGTALFAFRSPLSRDANLASKWACGETIFRVSFSDTSSSPESYANRAAEAAHE